MKHLNNQWYAVTGGPSSGKTTLINGLKKLGYIVYPEAVRIIIGQEMAKGYKLIDIQGTLKLQQKILDLQLENEKNAPQDKIVFFDRGIPDGFAYTKFNGLNLEIFRKVELSSRYKKVFFCRQLPFEKDGARIEDEEWAQKLSLALWETYTSLDYRIIDLSGLSSVQDRINIVLREISN